jgi:uncharacterized protein (TIGR00369 family)
MIIRQILKTHIKINNKLSGDILDLSENYSKVRLKTISKMITDQSGLIHGGFIFSLADFASMIAINHPNVVLAGANVKFLKPVRKGDIINAEARVLRIEGKKNVVEVIVKKDTDVVFTGEFICFIPEKHILEKSDA